MLSFLETIFSKLYQLFGGWWSILSWILSSAYHALFGYVTDLHTSLTDYKWYRMASLIYYQTIARPKTDDIAVNNYSTTRYSAIDSFWDILDYRNVKKKIVDWLGTTAKNPIETIVLGGFSILLYIIRNPIGAIQYVLERGRSVVFDYEITDKSNVKLISPNARKIKKISDEPSYSILDKVTGGWYSRIRTYVEDKYPTALSLFDNASRIFTLVIGGLFPRLTDLGGDKYPKISNLAERYEHIASLIETSNRQRLDYLTRDKFSPLFALLENPSGSILAYLKGKFFEWFLNELWEWLNEEI
jgi:hypothetical protein